MTHNTVTDFLTDRKSITIGTTLPCFHIHYQILISSGSTIFVDPLKCGIFSQLLKYLSFHTFTSIIRRKARTRLVRKHRPSHSDLVHSSDYADNFFLPFALLLASTFLPFAVLILLRKPWTLDLCLFFGWYVIFIPIHLLHNNIKIRTKPNYIIIYSNSQAYLLSYPHLYKKI